MGLRTAFVALSVSGFGRRWLLGLRSADRASGSAAQRAPRGPRATALIVVDATLATRQGQVSSFSRDCSCRVTVSVGGHRIMAIASALCVESTMRRISLEAHSRTL
jgi:hypothetical protein